MSNPKVSPLASAIAALMEFDYRVVPIMPKQKRPGDYLGGKWKAMDGWQRFRQQKPSPFELGQWRKWPDANIGIVTGSPVGDGTILIAIDLDMRDRKEVARVVAALPKTPMSKTGAKGETLFFRATPEIGKTRVFDRVLAELDSKGKHKRERLADFLGAGRQTVVPPSQHPDGFDFEGSASYSTGSGAKVTDAFDYRWLRGPVAASELPLFDEAALQTFERIMGELGWSSDPTSAAPVGVVRAPRPATPRAPAEVLDLSASVHKRLNAAALADLDAWVPDLGLYRCQKARNGYEAVATWRASTTNRDDSKRKLNLSIQPNGIEDFGAATKYSPLDLVICAKGLSFNEAYEWLRGYITPPDDSGVVLAFDPSRARPSAPIDDRDPAPLEIDLAGNPDDVIPPPVKPLDLAPSYYDDDAGLREWPEELCFEGGLVGQVAKWIVDTASAPSPILAYGAALALVGTVAGRQFQSPTGTGTHLYVIGAAPTGVGKDHPIKCISIALHDAGMSNLLGSPDFTADSAVMRTLLEQPLSVSLMDEFGSFWKRINGKNSGSWETAITRALREAWGRSFSLMRTKQYAGSGPSSQDIWWPALSIYGVSTPGELFSNLSAADLENGMINRFLLLATARRTGDKRTREEMKRAYFSKAAVNMKAPQHIIDGMKAVRDWQDEAGKMPVGAQFGWPSTTRPTIPTIDCEIDEDAAELLFSYRMWALERSVEDEQFGRFYSRAAESAQRVALIHAIGRHAIRPSLGKTPPAISFADVEHAVRLVDWSLRMMWSRIAAHEAPSNYRATVQAVFRAIERRGGKATRAQLRQSLHGSTKRDLQEAIEELEEAGHIVSVSTKENPRSQKTSTHYELVKDNRPSWASQ